MLRGANATDTPKDISFDPSGNSVVINVGAINSVKIVGISAAARAVVGSAVGRHLPLPLHLPLLPYPGSGPAGHALMTKETL